MEKHSLIDAVEIVCVTDFIDQMWAIVKEAGLQKVKWIVAGGATAKESHGNGIVSLEDKLRKDDILMIHMSSYPLANAEIITDCIESAKVKCNGCTARPILCFVYITDVRKTSIVQVDR